MKRAALVAAGVIFLHALIVSTALIVKYEYWGTPASFRAGAVQRFIDRPVVPVAQFLMNSPELPTWMPSTKASDAALVRELLVFDLCGGLLYGTVAFVPLALQVRRRRTRSNPHQHRIDPNGKKPGAEPVPEIPPSDRKTMGRTSASHDL